MTRRVLSGCIALVALILPTLVAAQPPPPLVIPAGQPFQVEWNSPYPNDGTYRFSAQIDGATSMSKVWTTGELTTTAGQPVADCYGTTTPPAGAQCLLYRATHPQLSNRGTRSIRLLVVEVASGLPSPPSPTVTFIVGAVPLAPTNPRVVVTTTQAGVTFEFKSAPVNGAQAVSTATLRFPTIQPR